MNGFLEKRINHKTLLWGLLGALWVLDAAAWAQHIAVHPLEAGNLYVADRDNHRIREVSAGGLIGTVAGSEAVGFADGTRKDAQFHLPRGIAVDVAGNLYVADAANNRIRKVTPSGLVSTLVHSGSGSKAVWGQITSLGKIALIREMVQTGAHKISPRKQARE